MENYIIAAILVVIIGAAIAYIIKAKKKGVKCIGCPAAGSCAHKNKSSECGCECCNESSCGCHTDN